MKRLLIALLLVFLLSLTIPALRSRAVPKYRAAGSWVWGHLQGPLSPIITPWKRLETESEMAAIVNQLIKQRNRGFPPPRSQELPLLMQRAGLDSTATDEWGSPYDVFTRPDSVYLRSAGPDATLETEDDIVVPVRYSTPPRSSRRRR